MVLYPWTLLNVWGAVIVNGPALILLPNTMPPKTA